MGTLIWEGSILSASVSFTAIRAPPAVEGAALDGAEVAGAEVAGAVVAGAEVAGAEVAGAEVAGIGVAPVEQAARIRTGTMTNARRGMRMSLLAATVWGRRAVIGASGRGPPTTRP
jgi:hypothetical protein